MGLAADPVNASRKAACPPASARARECLSPQCPIDDDSVTDEPVTRDCQQRPSKRPGRIETRTSFCGIAAPTPRPTHRALRIHSRVSDG
jgi:hypothetical protein